MRGKLLSRRILLGLILPLLALTPVQTASAIVRQVPESTLYLYGLNGIYFYNGAGQKCTNTNSDNTTPGNYNYSGNPVWSDAELAAIEQNRPVYETAAEKYDFPWQILAVIHSSETALRRYNPGNGQGVYQLYSYTAGGTNSNRFEPAASIPVQEFARQTDLAAEFISKLAGDDDLNSDPDAVKRLFFRYNGRAAQYIEKALALGFTTEQAENGEGSPYVMNRYDAERDPTSANVNPLWSGRFTSDGHYNPNSTSIVFGAYVKYEALTGNGICSASGNTIAETALELSWGDQTHAKNDPKPEYITAMRAVGAYQTPCNSICAPIGASCDQFVGTVMRYSGADTSFPIFAPALQEAHMIAHPEMYTQVDATDVSDLEPGDIFVTLENGRHIYLYIGEVDGAPSQASASFNDRTGEHFPAVYFEDSGTGEGARHYKVYRRIGV